jgi:hypothetical protein
MGDNQGRVSPITSSSSNHDEKSDNHLEYYVEGGEKMNEKGYNVSDSTEPDPSGNIAVQKELAGEGTYSTTANSTVDAPSASETTEPMSKAACDGDCCSNCSSNCDGDCCEKCMGMSKSSCCSDHSSDCNGDCCDKCMGMSKSADQQDDDNDADSEPDADVDDIQKKDFSTARRKQLAREGKAMGDGSYPIENQQDLKNAIRSWGRGGARADVKQHIIRRAKALGKSDLIPEDWKGDIKKSIWGSAFLPVD